MKTSMPCSRPLLRQAVQAALLLWTPISSAQYISLFSEPESQSDYHSPYVPNPQPIAIRPVEYEPIAPVRSYKYEPPPDYQNRQYEEYKLRQEMDAAMRQEQFQRQREMDAAMRQEQVQRQREMEEMQRQLQNERKIETERMRAEQERALEQERSERTRAIEEQQRRDYYRYNQKREVSPLVR